MTNPDQMQASAYNGVPPRAAALLRGVAERLDSQVEEIAEMMVTSQRAEIPAYRDMADESLIADVRTVSVSVVRMWLTLMSTGQPIDDAMLTPVREGARRRVVQGMDVESLLRGYRVGIRVMWSEIISSPGWQGRALHDAMGPVVTWVLNFSDLMSSTVAAAYIDEAAKLAREREHRRSSLLNLILAGPAPDQHQAPEELDLPHCVVVARVAENLPLAQLEQIGYQLESHVDAVLWTVRHSSVVVVVRLPDPLRRQSLRPRLARMLADDRILAFGVGNRAEGPTETRQSHTEASEALMIGPQIVDPGPAIYDYSELAPMIALLQDPARARRFARTTLEPMAAVLERKWALATLDAYLSRQGRLKDIAAVLNLHPSTVKYRLNELRPHLAAAGADAAGDGDRAATLLLAVRVDQYLTATDKGAQP